LWEHGAAEDHHLEGRRLGFHLGFAPDLLGDPGEVFPTPG